MSFFDARHKYIVSKLVDGFGIEESVCEKRLTFDKNIINSFLEGKDPAALRFFYQLPESKDGQPVPANAKPVLTVAGPEDRLVGKCVYFVRLSPKAVSEKTVEADLATGEVSGNALEIFKSLVADLYVPILEEQSGWGKAPADNTKSFLTGAHKFGDMLTLAASSLRGAVELQRPEPEFVKGEAKPSAFHTAAANEAAAAHFIGCMESWCSEVDAALRTADTSDPEAGPDTELEYWRTRMAALNYVQEQLKANDCKWVLGVCAMAKAPIMARWKELDIRVSEANNEAKDNVKFLTTLESMLEVLMQGTIEEAIETLPTLLANVKLIYEIARFYNTPANMTRLLLKISNQIVRKCKDAIMEPGKIWDQDRAKLLATLRVSVEAADTYREHFASISAVLAAAEPPKTFDEEAIFYKLDLFSKRMHKLIELFSAVVSFSSLEQHTHISGLEKSSISLCMRLEKRSSL